MLSNAGINVDLFYYNLSSVDNDFEQEKEEDEEL